jgi:hypothetical protein
MLYYLPNIKLIMDINDVCLQARNFRQNSWQNERPKSCLILVITDCAANHAKFVIMMEPDPHKNSATYGQDCQVVAKYKITTTEDKQH